MTSQPKTEHISIRCTVTEKQVKRVQEFRFKLEALGVRVVSMNHDDVTYDVPAENIQKFRELCARFVIGGLLNDIVDDMDRVKLKETKVKTYSFCESVTGIGPWHIRELGEAGLKLGGGIDTPTLCDLVRPIGDNREGRRGGGGWDVQVAITEHHLSHACIGCVAVFRFRAQQAQPFATIETPVKNKSKIRRLIDRILPPLGGRKKKVPS